MHFSREEKKIFLKMKFKVNVAARVRPTVTVSATFAAAVICVII